MARAEADGSGEEDPQGLPKELADPLRSLAAARGRLEARGPRRGGQTWPRWRRASSARAGPRASAQSRPSPRPDEQSNLSDPDSRLMRKSKHHEYRPITLVVDARLGGGSASWAPGSATAPATKSWWRTSRRSSPSWDCPERSWPTTAMPTAMTLRRLAESGFEALVATAAEGRRRATDFLPGQSRDAGDGHPRPQWLQVMAASSPARRAALYRLRQPDRRAGTSASSRRSSVHRLFNAWADQGGRSSGT